MKRFLFIQQNYPFQNIQAFENQELVLAITAFEQRVSLLFIGNGILQLLEKQSTVRMFRKNFTLIFKAANLYGVDAIYVDSTALSRWEIKPEDLMVKTTQITPAEIKVLAKSFDFILATG